MAVVCNNIIQVSREPNIFATWLHTEFTRQISYVNKTRTQQIWHQSTNKCYVNSGTACQPSPTVILMLITLASDKSSQSNLQTTINQSQVLFRMLVSDCEQRGQKRARHWLTSSWSERSQHLSNRTQRGAKFVWAATVESPELIALGHRDPWLIFSQRCRGKKKEKPTVSLGFKVCEGLLEDDSDLAAHSDLSPDAFLAKNIFFLELSSGSVYGGAGASCSREPCKKDRGVGADGWGAGGGERGVASWLA